MPPCNPPPSLSPAEIERLAILIEEAGEVIQAASKILRHGYESGHPDSPKTNRQDLERELGDFQCAMTHLAYWLDIDQVAVTQASKRKLLRRTEYMHHQPPMDL